MPWTKIKNQCNNPKKLSSKNRKEKLKQHKHQGKNESQSKKLRLQKITKEKKMREWNKKKHTQLGKANGQMGQSKWANGAKQMGNKNFASGRESWKCSMLLFLSVRAL